ncbi:lytic transglycosylase domain-containing protein [Yoonia vestfoldensis]|uniref:Soluble lytic murein transglycosylase n=1 Tax=Yoonia vestfoldensis TaxID=245188 RepID=A0A1Y0EEV8_9RHOB|nr:lytic transglycosylase domain-containing protein [Yoonia vestfoldensis]ARU02124.1 soluble lytic murein transglycosylase [Yoonia vestfoldensis]
MRLSALCFLSCMVAMPVAAQQIDQSAVAAVVLAAEDREAADLLLANADPVARDVLTWLRLRAGDAEFADYPAFVAARPDWPGLSQLRRAAEPLIPADADPQNVIAWFDAVPPATGAGVVRLVAALRATGQAEAAEAALRNAWLTLGMDADGHAVMMASFADRLAPWHVARADALLWRGRSSDAARLLPVLPADQRALIAARIGYATGTDNMLPLFNAVPAALRDTPGLLYARYSWLAARGDWTEATEVLRAQSTSAAALQDPFRWSGYRRVLARWHMREGRADLAYALAASHFLAEGEAFADLEWLAGYIALIYQGNPVQALAHFDRAAARVSGPISVARMQYWIGRAQDVKGNNDLAIAAYARAADHQTTFYGLLASERIDRPLDAGLVGADIAWQGAPVFDDDLTRAALILLAGGERGAAVTFFAALGERLEPDALRALGAYLSSIDEDYYTLLLGKTAAARGIVMPEIYYPVHDLAQMDLPVDPALALSIARRESEFNIGIASPVGALGLMQVMPATAEEVAGWLGLPYSRARLTSDWPYNATLGAAYLAYLQDEFGPSPVMIAAGYNAGPSRPRAWMRERGDPRLRQMDVVDWIEHIPFVETRNYVQRVTESLPVYQARLSGQAGPVRFTALLIGQKPVLRPVARPARD